MMSDTLQEEIIEERKLEKSSEIESGTQEIPLTKIENH